MAKFLATSDITSSIEKIIKEAREELVLISPYLKFSKLIKNRLEDKDRLEKDKLDVPSSGGFLDRVKNVFDPRAKVDIHVIYGKDELKPNEREWLGSLTSVKVSFCDDLHAKCYLNESLAIVTSMNLYEYSQQNNYEMGILVSRQEDPELYEDIRKEAERIERGSQRVRVEVSTVQEDKGRPEPKKAPPTPSSVARGFCIRCKDDLTTNPLQPYCKRCFTSWNRFKNEDYEEKHCHTCGKEHEATMKKPVCLNCYRKYRNVLEFAAS